MAKVTMAKAHQAWVRYESSIKKEQNPITIKIGTEMGAYTAIDTATGKTLYFNNSRGELKGWCHKRYAHITWEE